MTRRRRKKKITQELNADVDYMNEVIEVGYGVRRKVAINYDKACKDLGVSRDKMLHRMMADFVLEVYRDKIKNASS